MHLERELLKGSLNPDLI